MRGKKELIELVSKGHTAEALKELLSMNLSRNDRQIASQINASFVELQRNIIEGIMDFDKQSIEQARINKRLLKFLNGEAEHASVMLKQMAWNYVVGAGVVVSILTGFFQFGGKFWGRSPESFSVTVFVHGKKGKDDRILRNQGQIMLGLRTSEMPCSINEKGEATFKEIPMGFEGEKVLIRVEHPQPYRAIQPDSLYLLKPNAAIYLEIALEGTNRIFGKVMDYETEQWLDSVRVSVENVATYSDAFGWFELEIPEKKQRKFQRISIYKKGYMVTDLDSIPVHVQQEINISLRKSRER